MENEEPAINENTIFIYDTNAFQRGELQNLLQMKQTLDRKEWIEKSLSVNRCLLENLVKQLNDKTSIVLDEVRVEFYEMLSVLERDIGKIREKRAAVEYLAFADSWRRNLFERDPREFDFKYKHLPGLDRDDIVYKKTEDEFREAFMNLPQKNGKKRNLKSADISIATVAFLLAAVNNKKVCIVSGDHDIPLLLQAKDSPAVTHYLHKKETGGRMITIQGYHQKTPIAVMNPATKWYLPFKLNDAKDIF